MGIANQHIDTGLTCPQVFEAGYDVASVLQKTDEWLAWRQLGIGASSVPTIMGESPFETPYGYWAIRVGLRPPLDLSGNPNVQRGNKYEEEARAAWEARYKQWVVSICAVNNAAPWLRVSYDGVTAGTGIDRINLEIKCPNDKKMHKLLEKLCGAEEHTLTGGHDELKALGFGYYYGQLQYQMLVAGCMTTHFWLYDTNRKTGVCIIVSIDIPYCEKMLPKVEAFWGMIQSMTAPEFDPERDVYDPVHFDQDVRRQWDLAEENYTVKEREIKALKAKVKALETERDEQKEILEGLCGPWPKVQSASGFAVTQFTRRGSIDYKSAIADLAPATTEAQLEVYRKESTQSVRVTVPKETG